MAFIEMTQFISVYCTRCGNCDRVPAPMYSEAGLKRTGCMFCPVPIAHGDLKNIEYARKHHPKIYAAIMEKHGLKAMLERLGIEQKDQISLF